VDFIALFEEKLSQVAAILQPKKEKSVDQLFQGGKQQAAVLKYHCVGIKSYLTGNAGD
jgi:hypothetical protein